MKSKLFVFININAFIAIFFLQCTAQKPIPLLDQNILPGANQVNEYLPLLQNKKIALIVNHTSTIGNQHIVDYFKEKKINVKVIFAPEHGYRGSSPDGEEIHSSEENGVKVISIYGKNSKPTKEDLAAIDCIVFDIQDVGCRFYTFISTLQYLMESAAEFQIPMIVLDRPNPNGFYIDGPVLDKKFTSIVGSQSIPVVYGMTIGEYATMLNGEKWIGTKKCNLTVVKCKNYTHNSKYVLPIAPSPNLPNMKSIYLYPSLCFFEGTNVSIGRGTDKQFQVFGYLNGKGKYQFTPKPNAASKEPPLNGKLCKGTDLSTIPESTLQKNKLNYSYFFEAFSAFKSKDSFFLKTNYIDRLAGSDTFRKNVLAGKSEKEIRKSWEKDITKFKQIRKKYLLYADFE
jgi:uncharacterized protein YbbC (DUF1343 family)